MWYNVFASVASAYARSRVPAHGHHGCQGTVIHAGPERATMRTKTRLLVLLPVLAVALCTLLPATARHGQGMAHAAWMAMPWCVREGHGRRQASPLGVSE